MNRLILIALCSCAAACGGTIDARNYRHTCAVDSDCVPVFSGEICSSCGCATSAISLSDLARYQADARALATLCAPQRALCECPTAAARCESFTCTLAPPAP